MYIANLVTQPGETDGYSVSDHIKVLNRYLGNRKVDIVLANNGSVSSEISDRYKTKENKYMVDLDVDEVNAQGAQIIADDVIRIEKGTMVHDEIKTAYLVFSSLM